ncbi:MAG: hypothetical protein AABW58_00505 [Nanoarchaeota archaeon]
MNKKAAVEIDEIVTLLKYLVVAVIIILILILLGKYMFTEIDLSKIFRLG